VSVVGEVSSISIGSIDTDQRPSTGELTERQNNGAPVRRWRTAGSLLRSEFIPKNGRAFLAPPDLWSARIPRTPPLRRKVLSLPIDVDLGNISQLYSLR